jgi:hypothetical protein
MRPTVAVRWSGSPEGFSFDDTVDPVDGKIFRRIGERQDVNG